MAIRTRNKASEPRLNGNSAPTGQNITLAVLAEFVGTFMLVLVGTAVATAAFLHKNTAGPAYDSLAIALSFGLILIPIVGALGEASGAHVNPSVTLGLAVVGKFPWRHVPTYWLAQLLGGIAASLTIWIAYGQQAHDMAHLGAPAPAHGASDVQVLIVEALIAFILTFTVVAVTTNPKAPLGMAPVAIGFALAAGVLLGGPVSGGAGNPARALGPMVVANAYSSWYMYTLGPLIGGVLGAVVYKLVGKAETPKVAAD